MKSLMCLLNSENKKYLDSDEPLQYLELVYKSSLPHEWFQAMSNISKTFFFGRKVNKYFQKYTN